MQHGKGKSGSESTLQTHDSSYSCRPYPLQSGRLFPSIVSKTPTCLGVYIVSACWRSEPGKDGYLGLAGRHVIWLVEVNKAGGVRYTRFS